MNNELRKKQIREAKQRLEILLKKGLMQEVKDSFDKDGTIYYSYCGILYWLKENNNCDKLVEVVKQFEHKYNALVYTAIFNQTEFGDCLSLLYVSQHKNEWEQDKEDLKADLPIVWVENINEPVYSEFGGIEIKAHMGGLIRIA